MRPFGDSSGVNEQLDIKLVDKSKEITEPLQDIMPDFRDDEEETVTKIKSLLKGYSCDDILEILNSVQAEINLETIYK